MHSDPTTRFGTIVLAGKPNVGKSTLLNTIVGEKLAIVSAKPQSTRSPVTGINTEGDCQLLFVDPPGLLDPANLLQESMLECAVEAMQRVDAVLHLHPATGGSPPTLESLVPGLQLGSIPLATVLTKTDLLGGRPLPEARPPVFATAAPNGRGVVELLKWCRERAKPGEFRYDPDDISDMPVRFFVAELVREVAFEVLDQELPYSLATQVDEFRENREPLYIRVILYVERESQKGMIIGKGGSSIKIIGEAARKRVEELLGERVYLDLWVKVLAKWRKKAHALRELGLPVTQEKERS